MNAQDLINDRSPRARIARDSLIVGSFGSTAADDRVRWWLQDHGLASGRDLTDAGKQVRRDLQREERRSRFGR